MSNTPNDFDPQIYFSESLGKLDGITKSAVAISERNIGLEHTGRQNRCLFIFGKLIAHNMSIMLCADRAINGEMKSTLLDHFSLCTLGRASIDASLMTMYLSHPALGLDEWNLRRHVLYLHDLTNRKRFLTSAQKVDKESDYEFFKNYKGVRDELRRKIGHFGRSLGITGKSLDDLCGGQSVFVSGSRGAVREAAWDVDAWDFHQSYLSAYVHSHPVSFMRANEYNISFSKPSSFQFGICGMVMDIVSKYTAFVIDRMDVFGASDGGDPLGQVD